MLKKILRSRPVLTGAGKTMAAYLRLVRWSNSFVVEPADAETSIYPRAPVIVAMWHGQHFMVPFIKRPQDEVAVMISRHGDGEINAIAVEALGMRTVRGSGAQRADQVRKRGGAQALRAALTTLDSGVSVAMTADVPKVSRVAGRGIITLAQLSGHPILPVAVALSRRKDFDSWDRTSIGLPFGKGAIVFGDFINVGRDADAAAIEQARLAVQAGLDDVHARAYALVGGSDPGAGRTSVAEARAIAASSGAFRRRGGLMARPPFSVRAYRGVSSLLYPFVQPLLARRRKRGKEDGERLGERKGIASLPRPGGIVVWLHGASVGELVSLVPIAEHFTAKGVSVLVTSGTVTSAEVARRRLPVGAIHQYVPLDLPAYVERFLDHWKPDIGVFAESELWPNLVHEAQRRGAHLVIVNARMSERSYRRWRRIPSFITSMLSRFELALAQTEDDARRLRTLGAPRVHAIGNIKFDVAPPPADPDRLAAITIALHGRTVFVAASTHPGEEEHGGARARRRQGERAGTPDHPDPAPPRKGRRCRGDCRQGRFVGLQAQRREASAAPIPTSMWLTRSASLACFTGKAASPISGDRWFRAAARIRSSLPSLAMPSCMVPTSITSRRSSPLLPRPGARSR